MCSYHPAGLLQASSRDVGDRYTSAMGLGVNQELQGLCSRLRLLQRGICVCNDPSRAGGLFVEPLFAPNCLPHITQSKVLFLCGVTARVKCPWRDPNA